MNYSSHFLRPKALSEMLGLRLQNWWVTSQSSPTLSYVSVQKDQM